MESRLMKVLFVVGIVMIAFAVIGSKWDTVTAHAAGGPVQQCTSTVVANNHIVGLTKVCTNSNTGEIHVTGFVRSRGLTGVTAVCHQDKTGDNCATLNPNAVASGFNPGRNCIDFTISNSTYVPERIDFDDVNLNQTFATSTLSPYYNRFVDFALKRVC